MSKKPPAPAPEPTPEPKKRPARKTPARKQVKAQSPQPAPAPKKVAKRSSGKKEAAKTPTPADKPSLNASDVIQKAAATARKTVRKAQPKAAETVVAVDEDALTPDDGPLMGCTVRQAKFVDFYIQLVNGSQAYLLAGFTAKNDAVARAGASRLLTKVNVRALYDRRVKEMLERAEQSQDRLMQTLVQTAYGDARELTEYHVGACRFCYGRMNRYQYTAGEWDGKMTDYDERCEKAREASRPLPKAPDPKGGTGYDWRKEPHPDCPECFGYGKGREVIKDTRSLSPAAVALYAGTKVGKEGIEVKVHSQPQARETLAKIFRLFDESAKVNLTFDASELEKRYQTKMQTAHARAAEVRERRFKRDGDDQPGG